MDLGDREKPLEIYGHAEDDNFSGLSYLQYSRGSTLHVSGIFIPLHRRPQKCFRLQNDTKAGYI
jgi:hypothetical protein